MSNDAPTRHALASTDTVAVLDCGHMVERPRLTNAPAPLYGKEALCWQCASDAAIVLVEMHLKKGQGL